MPIEDIRRSSGLDMLIERIDTILRANNTCAAADELMDYPDTRQPTDAMSESEKNNVVALLRINHAGEISAQGLYLGQALLSRNQETFNFMKDAANEERKHLVWCARRMSELDGSSSIFTRYWFFGSFVIGGLFALVGDQRNLGFVEETEKQVSRHLEGHLSKIPPDDSRTRRILTQMREDEQEHGTRAEALGAIEPPLAVKRMMSLAALIMKELSYRF